MQFGVMLRSQFPDTDDPEVRFQEVLSQARLADELGYEIAQARVQPRSLAALFRCARQPARSKQCACLRGVERADGESQRRECGDTHPGF